MWLTILRFFTSKVGRYVLVVLAALSALGTYGYKKYRAGQESVIAEQAKQERKNVEEATNIDRDVSTTKPDVVRERLRRFTRD